MLLKPFKDGKAFNRGYNDEEWIELDKELCNLISKVVKEILSSEKSQRITIKQIAERINYSGIQNSNTLNELPKEKNY